MRTAGSGTVLPQFVCVGALHAGTTALAQLLAVHPHVHVCHPTDLGTFHIDRSYDPSISSPENWRELEAYEQSTPPSDGVITGEVSPEYTAGAPVSAAAAMAVALPDVRLVYLVRDPLERALSHYRRAFTAGTEQRQQDRALTDPAGPYVQCSRYHARLAPFLEHFDRSQILVERKEDLQDDPAGTMARVFAHVGADPHWVDMDAIVLSDPTCHERPTCSAELAAQFRAHVADDVARLSDLVGAPLYPPVPTVA